MTPEQSENLKLGGAVVAGGILLYLLFGTKKDNSGGANDPTQNGTYIPVSTFNAANVAEGLFDAMNRLGTDETAVLEILKTVSSAQFAQVAAAFGFKPYNAWTGNDYGFGLNSLPLKAWLKEELSASDYVILKSKYLNQL